MVSLDGILQLQGEGGLWVWAAGFEQCVMVWRPEGHPYESGSLEAISHTRQLLLLAGVQVPWPRQLKSHRWEDQVARVHWHAALNLQQGTPHRLDFLELPVAKRW